nr:MAG TPA: hypothetical protein [Caudoviricetes sp.]
MYILNKYNHFILYMLYNLHYLICFHALLSALCVLLQVSDLL